MNAATDMMSAPPPPLPPPTPVRAPGVGEALGLLALYFGLQLAVGLATGALAGVVVGIRAGIAHPADPRNAMRIAMTNPDLLTLVTAATLTIAAGITLWLAHRRWPRQWRLSDARRGFGLVAPSNAAYYAAALALGVAVPIVGGILTRLLAGHHEVSQSISQMGQSASLGGRLLLALTAVSVGPLVEETMFRGVLFSALLGFRQRGGTQAPVPGARVATAMLVSALLFGMVHLPDLAWHWYAVPNLALLGLGCAWLRLQSGSLWPSIAAHSVNNMLAVAGWFVVAHAG